MKKTSIVLVIGIIFIQSFVQISIPVKSINSSDYRFIDELQFPSQQSHLIVIDRIEDGLGLTIYIKNIGVETVQNINLNTEVIEGSQLLFLRKNIPIPSLDPGETTKIHMNPFGFSLGVLTPFSMISFSLHGSDILPFEWGIITMIIGPSIRILGTYFNSLFSSEGYTLFSPELSTQTYLINNHGKIVHTWKSNYIQALGCYLLENGCIVRTCLSELNPIFWSGGLGGRVEIIDWNGTLIWGFDYANDTACLHQDVEVLPNGNILMTTWEYKTVEEAIAAGRNPLLLSDKQLWPDHIIEVKPIGSDQGEIVWEWHVWDHLIQDYDPTKENYGNVSSHPELVDINIPIDIADWMHTNSIDYNEEFDQILISIHNFNEIWIIDHSTTSEEAAGHTGGIYGKGGDLLYRWGNPQTYRTGTKDDQQLFGQHDAQWIDKGNPGEGHILIFNNGWDVLANPNTSVRDYSSIDEIVLPVDEYGFYHQNTGEAFGPKEPIWTFTTENPHDFFSPIISGCQRLPNGNTLICHGTGGVFFEVNLNKNFVWVYTNQFPLMVHFNQFPYLITGNQVYKIRRYTPDYPGLKYLFE